MNAEFQRKARRIKKAFLSDRCKEIEETNRISSSPEIKNRPASAGDVGSTPWSGKIPHAIGQEIEKNSIMGKTRYLFKKIRDTKGTFHAKMITIKDRNCMDLTEAEDTFKRRQGLRSSPRKRNGKRQNGCLTRTYK